MLLTNRRHRVLYLALAAMEIGWLVPAALLAIDYWVGRVDIPLLQQLGLTRTATALGSMLTVPPLITFLFFLLIMVFYMLVSDLLNQRQVATPQREVLLILVIVGTSLLTVRLLIYGHLPPTDLSWLGQIGAALFNFTAGRRPEVILLLLNAFLWFRVANFTERDLSFFGVGLSFRLGILLAVTFGALLAGIGEQPVGASLTYFFFFMVGGLTAVSVARIDEKALLVGNSRGSVLPWRQLAQIVLAALVTTGLGYLLALVYTPATLRTVLGWFTPVWELIRLVLAAIIYAFAWLLAPLMERAVNLLRWLMSRIEPIEVEQAPVDSGFDITLRPSDLNTLLDQAPTVRYVLVALAVVGALLLIWFFFLRTPRRELVDEDELFATTQVTYGGGLLERGMDRLRSLFDLVRRYGLGSELLAAISIQNIYANVSRLARRRGFPRHPSQPPDAYLTDLRQAFPGCADALARITAAYMLVAYGDRALDDVALAELRAAYRMVREAPEPEPGPTAEPMAAAE